MKYGFLGTWPFVTRFLCNVLENRQHFTKLSIKQPIQTFIIKTVMHFVELCSQIHHGRVIIGSKKWEAVLHLQGENNFQWKWKKERVIIFSLCLYSRFYSTFQSFSNLRHLLFRKYLENSFYDRNTRS